MAPSLQFVLLLSFLLVVSKVSGLISVRLRQPSVLGELIAGVLIGPSLFNVLQWPVFAHEFSEMIHLLAELGVLMLMFVAGLELHFSELLRNVRVSAFSGTLGVVFPVLLGALTGRWFGFDWQGSIFLGLTLGATSVSISAQTLMELRVLRSRVGLGLLGAAVFDDVLVIIFLSFFLALGTGGSSFTSILLIFVRIAVFLFLSVALGLYVLPWLTRRVAHLPISQGVLTLGLVVLLTYGFAAEFIGGIAAITGAFLAGLMFSRSPEKETLERGITAISYGFFVPIFFLNVGMSVDIRGLTVDDIKLAILVCLVALLGKLVGGGIGARLAGLSTREASQLGMGMVSRGEVGLILATVGLEMGVIEEVLYSVVLAMVLFTTLVTPPSLRWLFRSRGEVQMKSAIPVHEEEEVS